MDGQENNGWAGWHGYDGTDTADGWRVGGREAGINV